MSDPLQDAAAQQQSPDTPVPLPVNPAGGIMGTAPNQQQTTPPTQTAQPSAGDQIKDHLATVGHAVQHFAHALEGKQVNYVTDPATGDVTSQVVPRKPGGFFRDILLGAIAGGAAASQPVPAGSGKLVGFTRGAQAGLQVGPQEEQIRQNRATQQGSEIQQSNKRLLEQAAIAHDTVSSLNLGHHIGFHDDSEVDQLNKSVGVVKDAALKNGGQLANLPGNVPNGQVGNGPAMMAAMNQNPDLMVGPEGYHRIPLISYDTSSLQHKNGEWVDKDGNAPDWNRLATVAVVDLPNDAWSKQIALRKADANIVAGRPIVKGNPNDTVQASFGSIFGLGLRNKQDLIAARTERNRGPKDENEARQWTSAVEGMDENDPDYALAQARAKKGQAALDSIDDKKNAGKGAPPVKTLPEAAVSLATAKTALAANPADANAQKQVTQAQAIYDAVVNAKKDELAAEYKTQLRLAKGKADAERQAKQDYDRNLYGVLTSGDQTGWTPRPNQFMTENQFNSAKQNFANGNLSKAQDVDKSYSMFQNAYGEYKAANGKLPTGAQSMLALSTHLSTTFGNVKGSRVTKDMIREHLGARSISDDALAGIQKLTSGDVLSPKQWQAFNDLITESRNQTWRNTVDNAHYRGLPADFLPEDLVPAQPSAPQSRTAASPQRQAPPPGATQEAVDGNGNVVGHVVNGVYVPLRKGQ